MRYDIKTLFCLMAMGSWVGSYSPPLDDSAPGAVGNAGTLELEGAGETLQVSLQRLSLLEADRSRLLKIEGESGSGGPNLLILVDVSENPRLAEVKSKEMSERPALLGTISSGPWPAEVTVNSSVLTVLSLTGSGPWELDAELALQTSEGPLTGKLQGRIG